jgi:GTP cyclohydrolase I
MKTSQVAEWLRSESGNAGTAHAQRSLARVLVQATNENSVSPIVLIDQIEKALGTPVQAAVKREDEQEFARINAENLMFCEDACRRLKSLFDSSKAICDYRVEVTHFESLHPHDAVAISVKGIGGGYRA